MGERLNNWTARQKLSASHLNEAWNLLRKLAGVVGYDLNSIGDKPRVDDRVPRIRIKITGSTQDGTKKRWKYDWVEVYKADAGYDGWLEMMGGLSGAASESPMTQAYNWVEINNLATGTYGNGVSSTNLTGTLTIKPIPNDTILRGWIEYPADGSKPEVWVLYENGIDGGC